jgi:hypothetical protein
LGYGVFTSGDGERGPKPARRLDADTFEDLPGKWQAAILKAEQSGPKLGVISTGA